jgi:hypothetical protein
VGPRGAAGFWRLLHNTDDVGYTELAKRLSEMGVEETEGSVTTKINRGAYPAWWLFAVMRAIGAHTLRLE